jgi:hypothetical protein
LSDALQKTISDKKSPTFDALYEQLDKDLRTANSNYDTQLSANRALAIRTKALETAAGELRTELAATTKERDKFKIDAEIATSEIASLKKQAKETVDALTDSFGGEKKLAITQELVRTRYAAYGGWACSALLGIGLLAAYIYYKPLVDDAPRIDDHPTHRID